MVSEIEVKLPQPRDRLDPQFRELVERIYVAMTARVPDAPAETRTEYFPGQGIGSVLPVVGSGYSASPVAADGKIYLSGEDGDILVVAAGPEFKLLATNAMGESLMATPALADGVMYIRGLNTLFAVSGKAR